MKWFKTNNDRWGNDDRIGIVCSFDNGKTMWYNRLGNEWDGTDCDWTLENLSDMNYFECTEKEARIFLRRQL